MILIDAIGEIPKDIVLSQSQIDAINQRKMSETGNLKSQLKVKNWYTDHVNFRFRR